MGYTHYWRQSTDFTTDQWSAICKDTRKIPAHCRKQGIPLQYEWDDPRLRTCVTQSGIHFNGAGHDGHETFYISRNPTDAKKEFSFCKTARKPYDLAVCLCLLRIAYHCSAITISSDGMGASNWLTAKAAYTHLFKEEPPQAF